MPFSAMYIQSEIIILSEVSQKEEDMPYDITCVWYLQYDTNEPTYETDSQRADLVAKGEEVGGGMEW